MTTLQRLKDMRECLLQIQRQLPTRTTYLAFLCRLADKTTVNQQAINDTKSLIRRALCGSFTLESWHSRYHGRDLSNQEAMALRHRWVRQLIRDCTQEIERLS